MSYPKCKLFKGYIGFECKNLNDINNDSRDVNNIENIMSSKKNIDIKPDKLLKSYKSTMKLEIKDDINHFSGAIGPIIIFEEVFNKEINDKMFEMGENYEILLFRKYDTMHLNIKNAQAFDYFVKLEKSKFEQNLFLFISPNVYLLFKFNRLD